MKTEMIFLTAVLGIAGISMLFSMANFLAKLKKPCLQERPQKMRNDWYAFFKTSDLYGDLTNAAEVPGVVNEPTIESVPVSEECLPQEAYA